jgi:hypothetical protein
LGFLTKGIKTKRRLSLKRRVTPPQVEEPRSPAPRVEAPFTPREIGFNRMLQESPALNSLVVEFSLVEEDSGEPIRMIPRDVRRLITLSREALEPERSYSPDEIRERLIDVTGVTRERADNGLNRLIDTGALEHNGAGRYFLAGSTPF